MTKRYENKDMTNTQLKNIYEFQKVFKKINKDANEKGQIKNSPYFKLVFSSFKR
jgi:hypothetical protein